MKTENLRGWLVVTLVTIVPRLSAAQEECPVAEIGRSCDAGSAGTCISATCTQTADGSTTSRSCGACVTLPSNACSDAGQPCGDGGVCNMLGAGGGSGSGNGSSSFMIGYAIGVCENPVGAAGDDGAARGVAFDDAAITPSGGSEGVDAANHAGSGAAGGSSCALSGRWPGGSVGGLGWLASMGAATVLRRRRRTTPAA
jgi:hypothetical protein